MTGAGQGIGRTIATMLADYGASVAVNDIQAASAEDTATSICVAGGEALAVQADVSRADDVAQMVALITDRWKEVDILVNNAAYMSMAPLLELQEAAWDRVLAVDLKGHYLTCRAVLPSMLANRWGRIINIASEWGITGAAGATHYAAAKAGVIGFTRALALEVAAQGVLVNAIAPGVIDTPQLQVDADYAGRPLEAMKDAYLAHIPVGRLGRPRDIALTVLLLVWESGDFYSGQVFTPNGGSSYF